MRRDPIFVPIAASALVRRALVLAILVTGPTAALQAQMSEVKERTIYFHDADRTTDGYGQASFPIRYQFRVCMDMIQILYFADFGALETRAGYWYQGRQAPAELLDRFPPVAPSTIPIAGTISAGVETVATLRDDYVLGSQMQGCLGQARRVGLISQLLGEHPSRAEVQSYLDELVLVFDREPAILSRTLRNPPLERELDRLAPDGSTTPGTAGGTNGAAAGDPSRAALARSRIDDSIARAAKREQARLEREREQDDAIARGVRVGLTLMNEADAAYARGDKVTALRLYGNIANHQTDGYFTDAQLAYAKQREDAMMRDVATETSASAMTLLSQITGFDIGLNFSDGYFKDDWSIGVTGGRVFGPTLAYLDFGVGFKPLYDVFTTLNPDTLGVPADSGEHLQWMFRIGGTIPKLALRLGRNTLLAPHLGYTYHHTNVRGLHLLDTGLMLQLRRSGFFRLDATYINGSPVWGVATGFNLR